jgi:hypothetical protein
LLLDPRISRRLIGVLAADPPAVLPWLLLAVGRDGEPGGERRGRRGEGLCRLIKARPSFTLIGTCGLLMVQI